MADWTIDVLQPAVKFLYTLPLQEQKRILLEIQILAVNPLEHSKPLQGRPERSIRVGDYRILFRLVKDTKKIIITRIGHRRDIYRK